MLYRSGLSGLALEAIGTRSGYPSYQHNRPSSSYKSSRRREMLLSQGTSCTVRLSILDGLPFGGLHPAQALIGITPRAWRQIAKLRSDYERSLRLDAARNLDQAIQEAAYHIEGNPTTGLPAPQTYPVLAHPGQARIKAGP